MKRKSKLGYWARDRKCPKCGGEGNPYFGGLCRDCFRAKNIEQQHMKESKNTVRLTESQLHNIIKESVTRILNEIGDTERGQYALGAATARRDLRQQQVNQTTPQGTRPSRTNGDIGDNIAIHAHNQRAKANGGNEFNQDDMETYEKSRRMSNANAQGYRNYMASMTNPSAEDYRTANIKHESKMRGWRLK